MGAGRERGRGFLPPWRPLQTLVANLREPSQTFGNLRKPLQSLVANLREPSQTFANSPRRGGSAQSARGWAGYRGGGLQRKAGGRPPSPPDRCGAAHHAMDLSAADFDVEAAREAAFEGLSAEGRPAEGLAPQRAWPTEEPGGGLAAGACAAGPSARTPGAPQAEASQGQSPAEVPRAEAPTDIVRRGAAGPGGGRSAEGRGAVAGSIPAEGPPAQAAGPAQSCRPRAAAAARTGRRMLKLTPSFTELSLEGRHKAYAPSPARAAAGAPVFWE